MKFENTSVHGFEAAIRGARLSFNSESDSHTDSGGFVLGPKDEDLMYRLGHGKHQGEDKFLRCIHVCVDITAPVFFLRELDTYKIGTTLLSSSFQHTGAKKELTKNDFTFDGPADESYATYAINMAIKNCNQLLKAYNDTGDYDYFRLARQLLPMGYNYTAVWDANYAVLKDIYHARKNHKLKEWYEFCEWIESLPYARIFI